MILFGKIKKWLVGTGFEVGEKVFWNNVTDSDFTGEYIVTTKRNEKGYVGIFNEKIKHRTVPYWYLKPLE